MLGDHRKFVLRLRAKGGAAGQKEGGHLQVQLDPPSLSVLETKNQN